MKKILLSAFGLALVTGAYMSLSDASRDAYHAYLYRQARETSRTRYVSPHPYRPFNQRQGDTRRLLQSRRSSNDPGRVQVPNLRYPRTGKRYYYSTPRERYEDVSFQRPFRPSSYRLHPWQNNLRRKGTVAFEKIRDAVSSFETYENQAFSVQVPTGWNNSRDDRHAFTSSRGDFSISIKRFDEACSNVSFTACAIALSTTANHLSPAQKIVSTDTIHRQSQYSDTVLHERVQTATFTETFIGNLHSQERYISRYFVADPEGGVYLIETRTSVADAPKYIGVSKKIFDSFRIYATQ